MPAGWDASACPLTLSTASSSSIFSRMSSAALVRTAEQGQSRQATSRHHGGSHIHSQQQRQSASSSHHPSPPRQPPSPTLLDVLVELLPLPLHLHALQTRERGREQHHHRSAYCDVAPSHVRASLSGVTSWLLFSSSTGEEGFTGKGPPTSRSRSSFLRRISCSLIISSARCLPAST